MGRVSAVSGNGLLVQLGNKHFGKVGGSLPACNYCLPCSDIMPATACYCLPATTACPCSCCSHCTAHSSSPCTGLPLLLPLRLAAALAPSVAPAACLLL